MDFSAKCEIHSYACVAMNCIPIQCYRILADNSSVTLFIGVSPNIYEPQLTPICIGFLENMDNSWYRYFCDRVYLFLYLVMCV